MSTSPLRRPQPRIVTMPDQMTPAMRRAAEKVGLSVTLDEAPFLDRLYLAMLEAARDEQFPGAAGMRRRDG